MASYETSNRNPGKLEFWVTGTLSPLARRQLEGHGIKLVEKVDKRIAMMD